jgi:hypothetical protein
MRIVAGTIVCVTNDEREAREQIAAYSRTPAFLSELAPPRSAHD